MITTLVIYAQILVGAVMRHMGAGLAIPDFPLSFGRIIPPLDSGFIAINFAHRCGAIVVTAFVLWTVARVLGGYRGSDPYATRISPPAWRARVEPVGSQIGAPDRVLDSGVLHQGVLHRGMIA